MYWYYPITICCCLVCRTQILFMFAAVKRAKTFPVTYAFVLLGTVCLLEILKIVYGHFRN